MLSADLSLKYLKKLSWNTSHVWLLISLIIWMLGIGGVDLYALPALIGLIILFLLQVAPVCRNKQHMKGIQLLGRLP